MDNTKETIEKEGLEELGQWQPVPGYPGIEMNTWMNPPPLRYSASKLPVATMKQLGIWDNLREQAKVAREKQSTTVYIGIEPAEHEDTVGRKVATDRIQKALDLLGQAWWGHTRYCTGRTPHQCMCGATQHNAIVAAVKVVLEGREGSGTGSDTTK